MSLTRITFELFDEKDGSLLHKKVYSPHSEERLVNCLTEIAHIHSYDAKEELLKRFDT